MGLLQETVELLRHRLEGDFHAHTIEGLTIGLFFTGVKLSNGAGGLCYTPIKQIPEAVCCPSSAGRVFDPRTVKGMKAMEALEALSSQEPMKKAVAIATLNAMSALCWQNRCGEYKINVGADALDLVRIPDQASVAVVGAIVPVMRHLKTRQGKWWVIEQDPRVLKADELSHFVPWKDSSKVLGKADVVIITGVTLINDTLEEILEMVRPGAEVAVMGPTASMLPDILFDRGIRIVGGVWVQDADRLLEILAAGGSGYHFFDVCAQRIVFEKTKIC